MKKVEARNLRPRPVGDQLDNDKVIVFISYAREDGAFAKRLDKALSEYQPPSAGEGGDFARRKDEALRLNGVEVRGDWQLARGEHYREQLRLFIRGADALIFVISPDSIRSDECLKELKVATDMNKLILPVVWRDQSEESLLPDALRYPHWTFLRETDDFAQGVQELIAAIKTDFALMPMHRHLLAAAEEWRTNKQGRSYLLRKDSLQKAEEWLVLVNARPNRLPRPTALESEYILASQQNRNRGQRIASAIVLAILLVLSGLTVYAFTQRNTAKQNEQRAIENAEEAQRRKKEAEDNAEKAREQEAQAKRNEAEAIRQKGIADEQAAEARKQARIAEARRREAERERNIALARQISARAEVTRTQAVVPSEIKEYQFADIEHEWPQLLERSVLLTIEAINRLKFLHVDSSESEQVLRNVLASLPKSVKQFDTEKDIEALAFSPTGELLAQVTSENAVQVVSVAEGKPLAKIAYGSGVEALAFVPNTEKLALAGGEDGLEMWDVRRNTKLWSKKEADAEIGPISISPDGRYIAAASGNNAIVWKAADGQEIARLKHDDKVNALAFSPVGKRITTASNDKTVRVWDLETGRQLLRLDQEDSVSVTAFSPDGKLIATASRNTAAIWDSTTGQKVKDIQGIPPFDDESEYIVVANFSPDGRHLSTIGDKGTSQLWDVESGAVTWVAGESYKAMPNSDPRYIFIKQSPGIEVWDATTGSEVARVLHEGDAEALAFNPLSKMVAIGNETATWVYDTDNSPEIRRIVHNGSITGVASTSDNKRLALAGSKSVPVWDMEEVKEITQVTHTDDVTRVVFSPDGKYLVTRSDDQTIGIWDALNGQELSRIPNIPLSIVTPSDDDDSKSVYVDKLFFTPSGRNLIMTARDMTVRMWDMPSGKERWRVTNDEEISDVAVSADEKFIVVAGRLKAHVLDLDSGGKIRSIEQDKTISYVNISPNDKLFVTYGFFENTARVWEVATGKQVTKVSHPAPGSTPSNNTGGINNAVFSPDSKYLITASSDKTARVWMLPQGIERDRIAHGDSAGQISFSPDGKYLITATNNSHRFDSGWKGSSTVQVWDMAARRNVASVAHGDIVNKTLFSADGRYMVTASADKTAKIYDLRQKRVVATLNHEANVNDIVFSPDEKYVVTASSDKTARVWSVPDGTEVDRVTHRGEVFMARISDDGQRLSTASMDKTARLWLLDHKQMLRKACSRITRNLTRDEWRLYFGSEPYHKTCPDLPDVTTNKP